MQVSRFDKTTGPLAREAAQKFKDRNVRGVVLDLRNNPGGLLDQAVAVDSTFAEAWGLMVDIASNSYWNLARDPALIPRARNALARVRALRMM